MAEGALCHRADQPPGAAPWRFDHFDFVTRWTQIGLVRQQLDGALNSVAHPAHGLMAQIEAGILGNVKNVRKAFVDTVTFWTDIHQGAIRGDYLFERRLALPEPWIRL